MSTITKKQIKYIKAKILMDRFQLMKSKLDIVIKAAELFEALMSDVMEELKDE